MRSGPKTRRARWRLVVAGLVLILGLVSLWGWSPHATTVVDPHSQPSSPARDSDTPLATDDAAEQTSFADAAQSGAGTTHAQTTASSPFPPLPPFDMPLAALRPALEAQARAGDPQAAFRLYRELERCARGHEDRLRKVSDPPNPAQVHLQRQMDCATQTLCGPVDDAQGERWDWLVQAAHAGHPGARLTFASGRLFYFGRNLRAAYRHREVYRAMALPWTLELARAGSTSALRELGGAYAQVEAQGTLPLAQLVLHDRVQAGMYFWLAAERMGQRHADPLDMIATFGDGSPLTPAEHRAAMQAAQRWLARHPFPAHPPDMQDGGALPLQPEELPALQALCGAPAP